MVNFTDPFDVAESKMTAEHTEEFGGAWRVRPMKPVTNGRPVADPDRPTFDLCKAIFDWDPRNERLGLRETNVSSRNPELVVHRKDLPVGFQPRRADQVIRLSDNAVFEITEVRRDGASGVCLELVQMGRQS